MALCILYIGTDRKSKEFSNLLTLLYSKMSIKSFSLRNNIFISSKTKRFGVVMHYVVKIIIVQHMVLLE